MARLIPALLATLMLSVPFSALAARETPQQTEDLGVTDNPNWVRTFRDHNRMMDTNHDGMISKKEYMTHQEMMWSNMNKNQDGLASMHDMDGMYAGTTKGNKLRPSGEPQTSDMNQ